MLAAMSEAPVRTLLWPRVTLLANMIADRVESWLDRYMAWSRPQACMLFACRAWGLATHGENHHCGVLMLHFLSFSLALLSRANISHSLFTRHIHSVASAT